MEIIKSANPPISRRPICQRCHKACECRGVCIKCGSLYCTQWSGY